MTLLRKSYHQDAIFCTRKLSLETSEAHSNLLLRLWVCSPQSQYLQVILYKVHTTAIHKQTKFITIHALLQRCVHEKQKYVNICIFFSKLHNPSMTLSIIYITLIYMESKEPSSVHHLQQNAINIQKVAQNRKHKCIHILHDPCNEISSEDRSTHESLINNKKVVDRIPESSRSTFFQEPHNSIE
jgi:hypothetical protein